MYIYRTYVRVKYLIRLNNDAIILDTHRKRVFVLPQFDHDLCVEAEAVAEGEGEEQHLDNFVTPFDMQYSIPPIEALQHAWHSYHTFSIGISIQHSSDE